MRSTFAQRPFAPVSIHIASRTQVAAWWSQFRASASADTQSATTPRARRDAVNADHAQIADRHRAARQTGGAPSPAVAPEEAARGALHAAARAALLEHYRPILRAIAARQAARLPPTVDIDDLVSAGTFGLMACLDSFDPAANVTFETYCSKRIAGAMVDYLRLLDWHPRLTQRRHRRLERVREVFRTRTGREALPEELRSALIERGCSDQEADQVLGDSAIVPIRSMWSKATRAGDESGGLEQTLQDKRQINPARAALRQDLRAFMGRSLARAERLILILYYYENMTMRDIGVVLGKSESRVSQMHQSVLDRLKAEWMPRGCDDFMD
ncbi:hypothetical protein BH11PLA1_BH11PLA1_24110 [soil metagenome]